jgi:hypothetical protein
MKSFRVVKKNPRGFALVVTLSLMILLAVLAVGLLSLSAVSLRASSHGNAQAEARANARMALMLAIGELQKQLGPDQRISMTADQRTEIGGDGSTTSSALGNRHWTGVYDSWPATQDSRPEPVFRSWLVSGELTEPSDAESALGGLDTIELVGAGTLGAGDGKVSVPTTKFGIGDKAVRVAWWVGDQGVKAAIATRPATKETTLGALRASSQGAPRNAVELAAAGADKPFSKLTPEDPRIPRLSSWRQAEFLASSPEAPRPLFHDLTDSSSGLLTNVRAGGFRKDLSMKFETFTAPPDLADPANVLYTARSQMTGFNEVGINLMELWSYYHLYKDLKYGGGLTYTSGGSIPSSAPYLQTKRTQQELNTDPWDRFKHPVTINYQTIYSFEADPHPDEPGKHILWLNFDPVVTLWNPLDVPVDIPRHLVNGTLRWNYLYEFWMIPYDINVSINGGPEIRCSILKSSNWKNDGNFLKLNAGVAETLTLKPGEILKISQDGDLSSNQRDQSVGGWEGFNGKKGFNYGGGARVPLVTEASSLTNQTDVTRVVVSSGDTVSYRVTPRAGSEAGNSRSFAMTHVWLNLGGRGQTLHGFMSVDSRYGYSRVQVGGKRTRGDACPNLFDIRANDHTEVYPMVEGPSMTRQLSVAALINEKAPFMVHSYFAKTEEESIAGSRTLARFNPRAYSLNFYDLSKWERDMMPFESTLKGLTSWLDAPLDESFNGQGFFGSSLGSEFGSSFVTTHSIPRQPIVSLAAFQHSFANGFNMPDRNTSTKVELNKLPDFANQLYPLEPQVSHAIGNSLAPSVIPPEKTVHNVSNYPHPLADHSYLANRALWDDWFLSGIAPQPAPAFPQAKTQEKVAREFFGDAIPLPVARYLPVDTGERLDALMGRLFSAGIPTQTAVDEIASRLRVDGMFNVNSTSVEAWKAVLGALRDRQIVTRAENGMESVKAADGNTPVANVGAPTDTVLKDDANMDAGQWNGRRTLSDDEIGELAQALVREIRKRGPFLSLADFVNRRVGKDTDLARSGAIQSALDDDEVSINKRQNSARSVTGNVASRFAFPEAEEGAMNYGSPSLVKQADILTPIAPILSARSDSFIIRAYGEAKAANGQILARAWCEAVVERGREYVDPSENATTPQVNLAEDVNRRFGREFEIVSFRWLNALEI